MSVPQERECGELFSEIDAGQHEAKTSGGLAGAYLLESKGETLKDS
jgi:hypothetical protein